MALTRRICLIRDSGNGLGTGFECDSAVFFRKATPREAWCRSICGMSWRPWRHAATPGRCCRRQDSCATERLCPSAIRSEKKKVGDPPQKRKATAASLRRCLACWNLKRAPLPNVQLARPLPYLSSALGTAAQRQNVRQNGQCRN